MVLGELKVRDHCKERYLGISRCGIIVNNDTLVTGRLGVHTWAAIGMILGDLKVRDHCK